MRQKQSNDLKFQTLIVSPYINTLTDGRSQTITKFYDTHRTLNAKTFLQTDQGAVPSISHGVILAQVCCLSMDQLRLGQISFLELYNCW